MTTTTTPTTPLTDEVLQCFDQGVGFIDEQRQAAAEIRALRAQRNDLLAALKRLQTAVEAGWTDEDDVRTPSELNRCAERLVNASDDARAAIARAEGRAEGK